MLCLAGSYFAFVDAQHDGDVFVLGGGRDDDLLRAGLDVALGLRGVGEQAGRLDHDVHAQRLPRQRGRAFLDGQALDLLAVDHQHVVFGGAGARLLAGDRAGELALGRIELEQVGEVVGGDDVVDGHHLDFLAQQPLVADGAEHQPPDAAEPVDANSNCHSVSPSFPYGKIAPDDAGARIFVRAGCRPSTPKEPGIIAAGQWPTTGRRRRRARREHFLRRSGAVDAILIGGRKRDAVQCIASPGTSSCRGHPRTAGAAARYFSADAQLPAGGALFLVLLRMRRRFGRRLLLSRPSMARPRSIFTSVALTIPGAAFTFLCPS